jgi:glycosyltransferase involved in cell wall biosynthesis
MVSIVTAYHNRKNLFYNTLKTIKNSTIKDIEVIVVDDCSDDEHRLEDFISEFPFLKIIRLEKEDKWYVNPCVPFNIGFKEAKGKIVIIQNPECLHVGDLLKTTSELKNDEYFSFACYSVNQNMTNILSEIELTQENILSTIDIEPRAISSDGDNGWYNHSYYRPVRYHFACAINKDKLDELGGFDERYAEGIAFDDNELLIRIDRMGLKTKIINNPFVVHQWHYSGNNYQHLDAVSLIQKNRDLLNNVTMREITWSVNK